MDEDEEFPWVLVGHWVDSSDTVHGRYRSAEAAEENGRRAWSGLARCTGWDAVLLSAPPVPDPRAARR